MLGIITSVASWILIVVLSFQFVAVGVGSATHFLETSGSRASVLNAHLASLVAAGSNVRVPGRSTGNLIHHRDRGTPANSMSHTTSSATTTTTNAGAAAVIDSVPMITPPTAPPLSLSLVVRPIRYICSLCRITSLSSSIMSIVIAITIIATVVFVTMSTLAPILTPLIVPSDITSSSISSISSDTLLWDDAETPSSVFPAYFSGFFTFFWKKRLEIGILFISSFILAFDALRRIIYHQQQRGKGRGVVVISPPPTPLVTVLPTLVTPSTPSSSSTSASRPPSISLPLTPLPTAAATTTTTTTAAVAAAQITPNQIHHQVQVDGGFFSERRLAAQAARAAARAAEAAEMLCAVVAATRATDAELKSLPASRLSLGRGGGGGGGG